MHARVSDLNILETLIDPDYSGVVVTGKQSATALRRHRREFPTTPLLFDTAEYENHKATIHQPFAKDDAALLSSLTWHLDTQLENGAPVAITPTRFIAEGERDVLRTVLSQTADLNRDDTLCLLPLDAKWLREASCDYLITILTEYPIPVVLILGHAMDPLGTRYAKIGLRRLLKKIPRLSLFRTDLAALRSTVSWRPVRVNRNKGFSAALPATRYRRFRSTTQRRPFSPCAGATAVAVD